MSEKPDEVYRNDQVESLKLDIQAIESKLDQLQFHMQNGSANIRKHCSKLIGLIENAKLDAQYSQMEIKVDDKMFTNLKDFGRILSTKIKDYETECIDHFTSDRNQHRLKFNEINSEINRFISEQKQYLAKFKINNCDVTTATQQATQLKEKLCLEGLKNKNDIYMVNQKNIELDIYFALLSRVNSTNSILG